MISAWPPDDPTSPPARERVSTPRDEPRTIRASFAERSYASGEAALLTLLADAPVVTLRMFHAGPEGTRNRRPDVMTGRLVSLLRKIELGGAAVVRVPIGTWKSGLYFARLEAPGGYLGHAPVVVRPKKLGESRLAVFLPTNTWQAYDFRDVDGDGVGDTWYAHPRIPCVDLTRPYLDRGPSRGFVASCAGSSTVAERPTSSPTMTSITSRAATSSRDSTTWLSSRRTRST